MANATLVTQKVQEIHLSNKLEKSGQIQLDSSFSLNVSFSSDGSRCVGKLQQTLRDKEFVGGKFTMTVELVQTVCQHDTGFFCRRSTLFRKVFNLFCNNRKSNFCFTGTRSLNGCI